MRLEDTPGNLVNHFQVLVRADARWDGLDELTIFSAQSRKVKILERAETMGDVPHAPNGFGKTLRVQFWTV